MNIVECQEWNMFRTPATLYGFQQYLGVMWKKGDLRVRLLSLIFNLHTEQV